MKPHEVRQASYFSFIMLLVYQVLLDEAFYSF